jgi:hypothetical protein
MEITLSLWSHRNDVVHGRDSAEKEVIKQQKFFAIVSAYYDKFLADSLFIPNHLHHLFSSSGFPQLRRQSKPNYTPDIP